MHYPTVYLPGVRDLYTWETTEKAPLGARVQVPFRGKQRLGMVVKMEAAQPNFKTQRVTKVVDETWVQAFYIELAWELSRDLLCSPTKVFRLLVPEVFWQKTEPVEPEKNVRLGSLAPEKVRGSKQQVILNHLRESQEAKWSELKKTFGLAPLKALLAKGYLTLEERKNILSTSGREIEKGPTEKPSTEVQLNAEQTSVFKAILESSNSNLLWGVTGSGKTEVYKRLGQTHLSSSGQMLLLVPEIGLTPQLIGQFQRIFGQRVAVWHSKLSKLERAREWLKIKTGQAKILIGARSAVLIPIPNLELIVVDEEHEWTYKNEFVPRFLTHDVVEKLAQKMQAKLVFGSATPRAESWQKTKRNWDLVRLTQTYHQAPKLEFLIVDLKNEVKKGNFSPVSERLREKMQATLDSGQQIVLFLNKRGWAGAAMCRFCGETIGCRACDVNLKVHGKQHPKLICHSCHAMRELPAKCEHCDKSDFQFRGWGTQQVQDWLEANFTEHKVLRADTDSLGGKHDFEKLLADFSAGKSQILIGTQMITKGLDFDQVGLVGVLLADVGLNLPDFRAEERVFQNLCQVSGRTGRRGGQGEIVIQTYDPEHRIFQHLQGGGYETFITQELGQRQMTGFSPFGLVIKLTIGTGDKARALGLTQDLYARLKTVLPQETESYWAPAFFPKMHHKYWFNIFIKAQDLDLVREKLRLVDMTGVRIDFSPSSLL